MIIDLLKKSEVVNKFVCCINIWTIGSGPVHSRNIYYMINKMSKVQVILKDEHILLHDFEMT